VTGGYFMPFVDVTDIVLNEETKELEELIRTDPKAKTAYEQFQAECKLRRELIKARKNESLTQAELQARTGLTQQTISRIEKNREISPSLRNLIKYASALGYELTLTPKQG
jgi:DNA-binding XRE family transcriptional regulator